MGVDRMVNKGRGFFTSAHAHGEEPLCHWRSL
jgi:hypothetical protein